MDKSFLIHISFECRSVIYIVDPYRFCTFSPLPSRSESQSEREENGEWSHRRVPTADGHRRQRHYDSNAAFANTEPLPPPPPPPPPIGRSVSSSATIATTTTAVAAAFSLVCNHCSTFDRSTVPAALRPAKTPSSVEVCERRDDRRSRSIVRGKAEAPLTSKQVPQVSRGSPISRSSCRALKRQNGKCRARHKIGQSLPLSLPPSIPSPSFFLNLESFYLKEQRSSSSRCTVYCTYRYVLTWSICLYSYFLCTESVT